MEYDLIPDGLNDSSTSSAMEDLLSLVLFLES